VRLRGAQVDRLELAITHKKKGETVMAKATRVTVRRPEPSKVPDAIEIPDIEIAVAPVCIRSITPLIINKFSDKTRQQLEDESTGVAERPRRGAKGKPPRDPEAEFQGSRILNGKVQDCFPARYLKAALVTAARFSDSSVSAAVVQGTVFVRGDLLLIESNETRVPPGVIPSLPKMSAEWVRRGPWNAKVPMLAYRALHDPWMLRFEIEFEPRMVSRIALIHLIRRAGRSVGLGEWRVEKKGDAGRFDLQLAQT
jgi:hypothetical protein